MSTKKPTSTSALAGFTSPETKEILTALAAVQAKVEATVRDQKGLTEEGKEYGYSSLSVTWAAVRVLAGENGLSLVQRFRDGDLHTVLFHSSGQWIDYGDYPLGECKNHNDLGAAISFARRYTLATVYGIAPEAEDDSAAGAQKLRNFKDEAAAISNPASYFESAATRTQWVDDAWETMRNATTMDMLRERFDGMGEVINGLMQTRNAEDATAVTRVRSAFDSRRDALSQPGRRRTVDMAASKVE